MKLIKDEGDRVLVELDREEFRMLSGFVIEGRELDIGEEQKLPTLIERFGHEYEWYEGDDR